VRADFGSRFTISTAKPIAQAEASIRATDHDGFAPIDTVGRFVCMA
jgi:hypothetical protein